MTLPNDMQAGLEPEDRASDGKFGGADESDDEIEHPPLRLGETIIAVNGFVAGFSEFLNRFGVVCEERLAQVSDGIARSEYLMSQLEHKLASATKDEGGAKYLQEQQEIQDKVLRQPQQRLQTLQQQSQQDIQDKLPQQRQQTFQEQSQQEAHSGQLGTNLNKFEKLVDLGMPVEQVKLKMKAQGIDPSLLERSHATTNDAQVPGNISHSVAGKQVDEKRQHQQQVGEEQSGQIEPPDLDKYRRMIKMGIPRSSVKQKATMDGIDPEQIDSI